MAVDEIMLVRQIWHLKMPVLSILMVKTTVQNLSLVFEQQ